MSCPFYAYHAVELLKTLIASGGNQCGLITHSFAPCRMEAEGQPVDFEQCVLHGTGRAAEFATFERHAGAPRAAAPYPD